MAKQQWRLKSFSNHIDPEKEEQLRRLKLGVEDQVEKILKITSDINHGNKERNLKKKSEAIELIQDFHKQYEKLYILYENLREKVKRSVADGGDNHYSPARDMDSESNYSAEELNGGHDEVSNGCCSRDEFEASDVEDTLTCSSVVTKMMNSEPGSPFIWSPGLRDILRDLEMYKEKAGKSSHMLAEIKYLEAQLDALKVEVSTLCTDKRRLEEEVEWRSNGAAEMQEKISGLEAQIIEMEAANNEKEQMFSSLSKQFMDDKQNYVSRISDLESQIQRMQLEMNSLKHEKDELEGWMLDKTNQYSFQVEGLMDQVSSLQQEMDNVNGQKAELKLQLENKSEEISECFLQMEALRNELSLSEQKAAEDKESLTVKIHDLESEIESLRSTKSDLEEQIKKMNHEASELNLEKERLQENVSELQREINEKENVLSTERNSFKVGQAMMSAKMISTEEAVETLKSKLETLENEKKLLQVELGKEKKQSSLTKSHLEKVTKTNFRNVERKIEEMAVEFRKQFEDQYRLLSRRIRVAEQLQAENKEWYRKTRDAYEQSNMELKKLTAMTETQLKNLRDLSMTANDLLTSMDENASKFEECTTNFQNRISKASWEINFAKNWAMHKNKALKDMKDKLDCLVVKLDDKEAKILASTEKVWKLENKVRELEKIIEEKEEETQVLTEEKREAIRQLCVWVDYHRDRSDFYKNLLSDTNACRRGS